MASTSWFKKNKSVDNDEERDRPCFFTYKELKKATGNFKNKIGDGGYGEVYEGKLQNKRTVAVKKLKLRTQKSYEQFNNEVEVLSRLHHPNLVVFYGCTKPHEELLLVYEFVPNNTLKYHLHNQQLPFVFPLRIKIAIQIAEGLSYLHSANPPVIHRDVKTDNILLDHAFHAKVADFGLSRPLPADETDITTITQSTAGYEDPEYKRCLKFTLKSDVYSFGVVLVELISRKKVVDIYRGPDNIFLNEIAPNIIMNKELEQLVDPDIGYHSNNDARTIIDSVAELALKCLQPTGEMRPPMVEVLRFLKEIYDEMQDLPIFLDMFDEIAQIGQEEFTARIYSLNELNKALKSSRPSRMRDWEGDYSKAFMLDGQTVAVEELRQVNEHSMRFFSGVNALYRCRHPNLVTFYGCTNPQEAKVLVLVYEFVSSGTLSDHLRRREPVLTWNTRIRVAIETAEVLVYLHSLQPQVIYSHVESENILLDGALHVKLAGLGKNGILPWDTIQASLNPGRIGYQDPEYNRTLRLTDKSDVYSFGVVLLELVSGKRPTDVHRHTEDVYLSHLVLSKIRDNKLDEFVDPTLGYGSDEDVTRMINSVVEVACMCLEVAASERPPMVEILEFLKAIEAGTYM